MAEVVGQPSMATIRETCQVLGRSSIAITLGSARCQARVQLFACLCIFLKLTEEPKNSFAAGGTVQVRSSARGKVCERQREIKKNVRLLPQSMSA